MVKLSTRLPKLAIPVAAMTGLIFTASCGEDEPTRNDLLDGEWLWTDFSAGEIPAEYNVLFHFEKAGDFEFCQGDDYQIACQLGGWEWRSTKKDTLNLNLNSGNSWFFAVDILNGSSLEGDLGITYQGYNYTYGTIKMTKVN